MSSPNDADPPDCSSEHDTIIDDLLPGLYPWASDIMESDPDSWPLEKIQAEFREMLRSVAGMGAEMGFQESCDQFWAGKPHPEYCPEAKK